MENRKTLEISWGSLWRILFFVFFVAVLYQGHQILLGLFLAIIISSGLEMLVNFLEARGIPRTIGVILIFFVALLLVIVVMYAIIPLIILELNTVFAGIEKSNPNTILGVLANLRASRSFDAVVSKLYTQFFSGNFSPLDVFSGAVGSLSLAVAVLVSSFYLSLSRDGVERFIKTVFPPDYEKASLKIYEQSKRKIGYWFRTQIILSLIMGFSVWGATMLLGVRHSFLLGVIAGFFEIVPFVGPILSGAVAVLVALSTSMSLGVYTLIAFLVLQQFESNFLVPLLMKKSVGLHPVIVIIALLIGGEVGGLLGLLIAVPAAAVFQEVIDEWSSKKRPTHVEGSVA
jgi:predicted PurR-regulated permease PerM